jgi:hypothetical protein
MVLNCWGLLLGFFDYEFSQQLTALAIVGAVAAAVAIASLLVNIGKIRIASKTKPNFA